MKADTIKILKFHINIFYLKYKFSHNLLDEFD